MKTNVRKLIALLLAVLMLTSFTVTASAEAHEHEYTETVIAPTCVQGYTLHSCACGDTYMSDYTEPIKEHELNTVVRTIAATCTAQGYQLCRCTRCNNEIVLPGSQTPMIPHIIEATYECTDEVNDFYRQINTCTVCHNEIGIDNGPFVPVTLFKQLDDSSAISGNEIIANTYAKIGGSVIYSGTPTLTKAENDEYAAWRFVGWDRDDGLDNINEPIAIQALFEGINVLYEVHFFYYNEYGTREDHVQSVIYRNSAVAPTTMPLSVEFDHYTLEFTGWSNDYSSIEGKTFVEAVYNTVPEVVTVYFHNSAQEVIKTSYMNYGESFTPETLPATEQIARASDGTYVYEFKQWVNEAGAVRNSAITEGGILNLYPEYYQNSIKYDVVVRAYYNGEPCANGSYQIIFNQNQNLITAGYFNAAGEARVQLNNGTYTVKCTSEDRLKAGEMTFAINTIGTQQTLVQVDLIDNSQYYDDELPECSCICHSVFSSLWVKVLNLLYSLFNIRYVCCNDMFAAHGTELKYTNS